MVSKQSIRLAIGGVLKEFEIDDLALEGRLATEVYGFFQRLESGENESLVEADMVDRFLKNHAEIKYRAELITRTEKAIGANISSPDSPGWKKAFKFLEKMERENNQTIEQFGLIYKDDKYRPREWKIAQRPAYIQEYWPQAFPEATQPKLFDASESGGGWDF